MSASALALEEAAPREAPAPARVPCLDELGRYLEEVLPGAGHSPLTAITMPAPAGDSTRILETLARADAFAFAPPSGPEIVALGTAHRDQFVGPERFELARGAIARTLGTAARVVHPDAPPIQPRAFCGFAFAPGSADREPWRAFGDGLVLLPRWTYFGGERPALVCIVDAARHHASRASVLRAELEAIFAALADRGGVRRAPVAGIAPEAAELHAARVEAALGTIRRGEARKLVVSRRLDVLSRGDFEPESAYRVLCHQRRTATAFFVRRAATTFVGATPELLLQKRGEVLRTMALAGTAARGAPDLRRSEKDLAEHRVVVEAILEALRPCARALDFDPEPHVASAGPMVHLKTAITATLRPGIDALAVAARLHPTPAVAGAPRETALRFLASHEPDRGWYAGPLGWIDAAGDAEVVVALRCGIIRGGRAIAYAGGGIVEGSTAPAERAETELKMRPFLEALGASLS